MQIIRDPKALGIAVKALKADGKSLGLVPTMGALHAGHMALVEAARKRADRVAASIFVNPTQFNDPGDLARYPRQEEADAAMLAEAGCSLLWMPTAEQMYPSGFATTVTVSGVADRWEGEARPGHFDGVATVVAKLLVAAQPDVAVFGEKDFQQLQIIRRMVRDLNVPVRIEGGATVREPDGLAMSSRNTYLSPQERAQAPRLFEALNSAAVRIQKGEAVAGVLAWAEAFLVESGFRSLDYITLVAPDTLASLDVLNGPARLVAAAWLGPARLIDNIPVEPVVRGAVISSEAV